VVFGVVVMESFFALPSGKKPLRTPVVGSCGLK
jgi:hypothetical protein